MVYKLVLFFFFASRRRHTRCALVTGVQTCALPISFTDGLKAVENAQVMRRALAYAKTFGLLIVQHPEEPSLAGGAMNGGELATRLGLPGITRLAEVMMIERDLRLVEMNGGRYYVALISKAESVEEIRRAKARGLDVTLEPAPQLLGPG